MTSLDPIRGVIFDIDGVLTYQGRVYPGAVETIEWLRERHILVRFLTNSTLKSRAACAYKLRLAGFRVSDEEVITASYATAVYLRKLNPRSCWVMVDGEGLDEFHEFVYDTYNPEYIVLGDNRSQFDFAHLNKALRLIVGGAKLIAMQAEIVDSSMGGLELNVGSWVGMLERAAGVQAVCIGKPNAFVFELALSSMGLEKDDVIAVGDRLETDIAGAKGLGLRSVLVKTGEFSALDLNGDIYPDYILDAIQGLPNLIQSFEVRSKRE